MLRKKKSKTKIPTRPVAMRGGKTIEPAKLVEAKVKKGAVLEKKRSTELGMVTLRNGARMTIEDYLRNADDVAGYEVKPHGKEL